MATLLCLNAVVRSPYVDIPLADGSSALDVLERRIAALDRVHSVVVLTAPQDRSEYPVDWNRREQPELTEVSLLETMAALAQRSADITEIVYWHLDEPFLDIGLTRKMVENHQRFAAEYSFADGYPGGLAPQILSPGVLARLMPLAKSEPAGRDVLFTILQRDINAFDVETLLADHDMRLLRLNLCCDSKRNWLLCRRLYERGLTDAIAIVDAIRADQELLRTLPAYALIEVVEGSLQVVAYSPYRGVGPAGSGKVGEMPPARFSEIVDAVEQYSPGTVFSIGVWGEPGLHSEIERLFDAAAAVPLVVETSGVGWDAAVVDRLLERSGQEVTWIVHLDAVDPQVYQSVRGDGFDEAMRFTEKVMSSSPDRCYVQTVRYTDVEMHTETFYRHWKERTERIIVQKYDHFCGLLEDKRVTDISPVRRFPCWHLKRDLLVLVDGTVPLCREDIRREHTLGNIFSDGVEKVWNAAAPIHRNHVDGFYPALCKSCDEYYTFNF